MTSYCSPNVVIQKKDGGVRIYGNYRQVNAVTSTDAEPMCDLQEIFARIINSKLFSNGLYHFKGLPFGLTNSPTVFKHVMHQVLHCIKGAEAFVNDVLVHSTTFEECLDTLQNVLL